MNPFKLLTAMFTSAPQLNPSECAARVRSGAAFLVDVREPGEWAAGVAHSARCIPLSDLTGSRNQWQGFLTEVAGREVLLYCASGGRSGIATRILVADGFRAANTGGLRDWLDAGWPVAKKSAARQKTSARS